jgi:c-opsin
MIATLQPTPQHQISDHQPHPTAKKMEQKKGNDAAEKRVTVMVACMVGAFLAAWTPYSILALFETFIGVADHSGGPVRGNMSSFSLENGQQFNDNKTNGEDNFLDDDVATISPAFATIPSLFAKSSAVLNPLIYGLLNTQVNTSYLILHHIHFNCILWLNLTVPIGLAEIYDSLPTSTTTSTPSSPQQQRFGGEHFRHRQAQ